MTTPDHDILIVGAGISGISMAAHLEKMCPDRTYQILDRRAQLGGTWDLFRYPGVRSDSDMHSLGFVFEPWRHRDAIADGPAILDYLNHTVESRGIAEHIQFNTKVISADWREAEAMWHVTAERADGEKFVTTARWFYLASGYYDYDDPHDAQLPGLAEFDGEVVHPQFWPDDLDYADKKIVVVGSGATAVTIVPAMAEKANGITMLQRTPTWMAAGPRQDKWAQRFDRFLPSKIAYWLTRQKNIRMRSHVFHLSRTKPEKVAGRLREWLQRDLGEFYDPQHFEPPYNPWTQRLCLVPDADLFEAIKAGKANVVTDQITRFDSSGVQLESGTHLPADIVITATGLKLTIGGKIAISRDGVPLDWTQSYFYRGCMFSNVANLAVVFGYLNASWTLRADNNAAYVCRIFNHMTKTGSTAAIPVLPAGEEPEEVEPFDYSSGYLQRARTLMPKSGSTLPWRLNQNYLEDKRDFKTSPVNDGNLRFVKGPESAQP